MILMQSTETKQYNNQAIIDETETREYNQAIRILSDSIENRKREQKDIVLEVPVAKAKNIDTLIKENNVNFKDRIITELEKNETEKRADRKTLSFLLKIFLFIQFSICFILIVGVFFLIGFAHFKNLAFEYNIIKEMFGFLKFYIGSVVVELISMLYLVVKNTFDTTISDIAKKVAEDIKNESKD